MSLSWKVGIWKEGKHVDLWHINHFISGILCACVVLILDMNLWLGFIISLILMIGWEVIEVFNKIRETKFNMYTDVVLSVTAFFIVVFMNEHFLSKNGLKNLLYISISVFVILGIWGFWAYKTREAKKR